MNREELKKKLIERKVINEKAQTIAILDYASANVTIKKLPLGITDSEDIEEWLTETEEYRLSDINWLAGENITVNDERF